MSLSTPDFPIFSLAPHFAATKDQAYRRKAIKIAEALAEFLEANDLLVAPLHPSQALPDQDFEIRLSHLNETGQQVVLASLDKWLRAAWSSDNEISMRVLERELKKRLRPNP